MISASPPRRLASKYVYVPEFASNNCRKIIGCSHARFCNERDVATSPPPGRIACYSGGSPEKIIECHAALATSLAFARSQPPSRERGGGYRTAAYFVWASVYG